MKFSFPFLLLVPLISMASAHATSPAKERDPSREWRDVPWTMRYILFLNANKHMKENIVFGKKVNAADSIQNGSRLYLSVYELFVESTHVITAKSRDMATSLFLFDQDGHVVNSSSLLSQFTGKLSRINSLVLIRTRDSTEKPYKIADWNQGIPGDTSFSPAVCTTLDSFRYDAYWQARDPRGHVGCREWTAQLYDPGQPYIDITTYSKRGNFIGELVGWSRFEDPPKPVIGMQGKQWLCLHECPSGERPGVIADLRAWTRKHGYPMPERPPRQPLYPDSEYQDDLNEFWNH